jgi:predicted HTH domain antitoxin
MQNLWIMTIELPDAILAKSHTTAQAVKLHIAIALFKEEIFTLGQAALLAELPQLIFQQELAKRKIAVHYDVEELRQDLQHLKVA